VTHRCTSWWRPPVVLIVAVLWAGPASQAATPRPSASARPGPTCLYAGRSLVEALEHLQTLGLRLIFSSELVHADMIIDTEPPVAAPRQVLDRLVAPFGLASMDGPAGTVLILRATVPQTVRPEGPARRGGGQEEHPDASRLAWRERLRVTEPLGTDPEPVTTVKRKDLERLPAGGDDASRAIAWLPGIAPEDASAQFRIRGGGSDEALVVLDGLEIDDPYHLANVFAFSSIIDARAIGRADVMTGIFPAEYGDRMSGVVGLSTSEEDEAERTVVGFSLIDASVLSGGRLGDQGGNWLVSARSWRPDPIFETSGLEGESLDQYDSDLLGKIQLRLPDGSIVSVHALASHDDLSYRTDLADGSVDAGDDHRYAWLNWKRPRTPQLYSQTVASTERTERSRSGGGLVGTTERTQIEDDRSVASTRLKQDWIYSPGGASLKWGFDARRLEADYSYRSRVQPVVTSLPSGGGSSTEVDHVLTTDPSGNEFGAYVSGRYRLRTGLAVELGVRRDRQSLTGESETSPRLNVAWTVGEGSVLRLGWGRFYQPQRIDQLQIEDGISDFFPAERARQWEMDLDHRSAGGVAWGVSAYLKDMDHLRPRFENLSSPFDLFPESEPDRVRVLARRAVARGLELKVAMDRGRSLSWQAYYALASAEDRVDDTWVPRSWDQRHTVGLNMNWHRGDAWGVVFAALYHSGWPTTEIRAQQVANPDGSTGIEPIFGTRNALRLPAYERFHLEMKRRYKLGRGALTLEAGVTSLYGHDGTCCAGDLRFVPQADGSVRVDRADTRASRQMAIAGLMWEF
jgi:outer membrane cobalamin receptor